MSDPNFSSVLDKPADDITRPPPHPRGHYLSIVEGQPVKREVGQDKTPAWDFTLKLLQPQPDVDVTEIEKVGGVAGKTIRATFFETEAAAWRLKQFLVEHLAIEVNGRSLRALMPEAAGHQVMVEIEHRPSPDGQQMFAQVKSTARV